jgi:hypothetical protein
MKTIHHTLLQVICTALTFIFCSAAFAQDKEKKEEGTMHIKISIEKDGKTTNIDTVINESDIEALNEKLKDMDINIYSELPEKFTWDGEHDFKFNFDSENFSQQMKELHEKMKEMKLDDKEMQKHLEEAMKNMKENFKGYRYHFDGDSLIKLELEGLKKLHNETGNMNFNFDCDGKKGMVIINSDSDESDTGKTKVVIVRSVATADGKEIDADTLEGGKVIVIKKTVDNKGEKSDVNVKVTADKKAKAEKKKEKAKLKKIASSSSGNEAAWLKTFEYFPNPTDGKLTVKFSVNGTEPVEISVKDISGREIYTETIEGASGVIEREINLSDRAKGAYLLAIRQGQNWKHEKIIVK